MVSMRVLFRLVWLNMDTTGLDGYFSVGQGHLVVQKATYDGVCISTMFVSKWGNTHTTFFWGAGC